MEHSKQWEVQFNGAFFEVIPVDDSKDHLLGDECWCQPRTERSLQPNKYLRNTSFDFPQKFAQPVIVHKSHDKREVIEVSKPLQWLNASATIAIRENHQKIVTIANQFIASVIL